MKILPEQVVSPSVDASATPGARSDKARLTTQSAAPATVEKASGSASTARVVPVQPETDVTFKRDQNGRIFYLVTDAKSGKELQEIPPKEVRSVGQGIEEYLQKEAQAAQSAHVEVKA